MTKPTSTLNDLAKRPRVEKQEFIDALETLASNGKDLGLLEASSVIAILDRCDPPVVRKDLEMLKSKCREASSDLRRLGKSWAAQDWAKILDAVEWRLEQMPR